MLTDLKTVSLISLISVFCISTTEPHFGVLALELPILPLFAFLLPLLTALLTLFAPPLHLGVS